MSTVLTLVISDVIKVRKGKRLVLRRRRESQIPYELAGKDITILGMAGVWLFIKVRNAFLGWYNPLLRSPANYISLPNPSWRFSTYDVHYRPATVLKFAFSALPTAQDSTILVVYDDCYLCMFRRENNVVVTKKATTANDRYHEVEEMIGFRLVTHWERDCEGSFRLVAVVENFMMAADLLLENNDGDDKVGNGRTTRVILVKDRLPLKRTFDIYYIHILFALFYILCMYSFSWIIFFLRGRLS
ncbi:unnamed protein product [Linum tenue]|uniref:Uncharacterized protein n=1 Tax=Linum tenue TaxID=586396 RepID=A0AAV0NEE0_9ROSI|nr:unnamed protein product [Linum tenue]